MVHSGICCLDDEPLAQGFGCICGNRRFGFCPFTCCKYDADALCWGSVCCSYQIDFCGLPRTILDLICLPITPCFGYECKDCLLYYFCCNPRKAAQDRMIATAKAKQEGDRKSLNARDSSSSQPKTTPVVQPVVVATPV